MINFTPDNVFDFLNLNGYSWDYLIYNENLNDFIKAKPQDFNSNNYNLLTLKDKKWRNSVVYSCLISSTNFEIYGFDNKNVQIYLEKDLNKQWLEFLSTLKTNTK